MTNQDFCYWLQGYFKIASTPKLSNEKITLVLNQLNSINEPLGEFTTWLHRLLSYLAKEPHDQALLDFYLPIMMLELNGIFVHVIDNSYDLSIGITAAKQIHDGVMPMVTHHDK